MLRENNATGERLSVNVSLYILSRDCRAFKESAIASLNSLIKKHFEITHRL